MHGCSVCFLSVLTVTTIGYVTGKSQGKAPFLFRNAFPFPYPHPLQKYKKSKMKYLFQVLLK